MYSDEVDAADVGRFQRDQTELWFRRAVQVRATEGVAAQATFLDIEYRSLIDDPVAAITHTYAPPDLEPLPDPAPLPAHHQAAPPPPPHGATGSAAGRDIAGHYVYI